MNIEQTEAYNAAVIKSAIAWVNGNTTIDNQMELMVIADHYKVDLPMYYSDFMYSDNLRHCCATGHHKWILSKLDKLAKAIKKQEGMF